MPFSLVPKSLNILKEGSKYRNWSPCQLIFGKWSVQPDNGGQEHVFVWLFLKAVFYYACKQHNDPKSYTILNDFLIIQSLGS